MIKITEVNFSKIISHHLNVIGEEKLEELDNFETTNNIN